MERNIHHHKYIRETLDADTDGAVAQIACLCFRRRIIVNIDDLVQIIYDKGGDALELGEVKRGGSAQRRRNYVRFVERGGIGYDGGARDYGVASGDGVVRSDGGDSVGAGGDDEDEPAKGNTGEVTHRRLVFIRILHDFGTQITAFDCANILLVALFIRSVFK